MIERLYALQGPSGYNTDMFHRLSGERAGDYVRLMGCLSSASGFSSVSMPSQFCRPDEGRAEIPQAGTTSSVSFASLLSRYMEEERPR